MRIVNDSLSILAGIATRAKSACCQYYCGKDSTLRIRGCRGCGSTIEETGCVSGFGFFSMMRRPSKIFIC